LYNSSNRFWSTNFLILVNKFKTKTEIFAGRLLTVF